MDSKLHKSIMHVKRVREEDSDRSDDFVQNTFWRKRLGIYSFWFSTHELHIDLRFSSRNVGTNYVQGFSNLGFFVFTNKNEESGNGRN